MLILYDPVKPCAVWIHMGWILIDFTHFVPGPDNPDALNPCGPCNIKIIKQLCHPDSSSASATERANLVALASQIGDQSFSCKQIIADLPKRNGTSSKRNPLGSKDNVCNPLKSTWHNFPGPFNNRIAVPSIWYSAFLVVSTLLGPVASDQDWLRFCCAQFLWGPMADVCLNWLKKGRCLFPKLSFWPQVSGAIPSWTSWTPSKKGVVRKGTLNGERDENIWYEHDDRELNLGVTMMQQEGVTEGEICCCVALLGSVWLVVLQAPPSEVAMLGQRMAGNKNQVYFRKIRSDSHAIHGLVLGCFWSKHGKVVNKTISHVMTYRN